jgi:hypothetical protein
MTASNEKSLDETGSSREPEGEGMVAYTAARAEVLDGRCRLHVNRLLFPPRMTWQDIDGLTEEARTAMARSEEPPREIDVRDAAAPFLHAVRRALLDRGRSMKQRLFFNAGFFTLETTQKPDAEATLHFVKRKVVASQNAVIRLDATLLDHRTGVRTPFRVWFEEGCAHHPPLRFEFQARSFLRLTFEADPNATVPGSRRTT